MYLLCVFLDDQMRDRRCADLDRRLGSPCRHRFVPRLREKPGCKSDPFDFKGRRRARDPRASPMTWVSRFTVSLPAPASLVWPLRWRLVRLSRISSARSTCSRTGRSGLGIYAGSTSLMAKAGTSSTMSRPSGCGRPKSASSTAC